MDGEERSLSVDTRTTLLDALREHVGAIAAKKGGDHGQRGSCTVLLDDRLQLSCLTLAVARDGAEIVAACGSGALEGEDLQPV